MALPHRTASATKPPPLPPRPASTSEGHSPHSFLAMSSQDPRSSSIQSLAPDPISQDAVRRRLLLVYLHGFMGDETSFRNFPAHVHNLVTITLTNSRVVHTKIYPKYKSKDTIEAARDHFTVWLSPHADEWTDIILLNHSMGGLLAAETVLLLRYNIIGVVNFDVPFLGMHPGIIKAGLGSLFTPPPVPQDVTFQEQNSGGNPGRVSTLANPQPPDPNYNPSFDNDIHLPVRKGWENSLHWISKHHKNLRQATKGLVTSRWNFASAMADWPGLKDRYVRVRVLEEDNDSQRTKSFPQAQFVPRVRFVNYYTASTGKARKPNPPSLSIPSHPISPQSKHRDDGLVDLPTSLQEATHEPIKTSPESELLRENSRSSVESQASSDTQLPVSTQNSPSNSSLARNSPLQSEGVDSESSQDLPMIPPIPQEPPFVDLAQIPDKPQRKLAEKEYDKALKEYQKAVKARNKVIHKRDKAEEKRQRKREEKQKESTMKKEKLKNSQSEVDCSQTESEKWQAESEELRIETEERQTGSQKPAEVKSIPISVDDDLNESNPEHVYHQRFTLPRPYTNYEFSRSTIMAQVSPNERSSVEESEQMPCSGDGQTLARPMEPATDSSQKKKLKKFCLLPPKDASGNKDPTWIRVLMEGMDEVTAHTSLFFMNGTYERLVGDVDARIEEWVRETDSIRLVKEMEGLA